MTVFPPIQPFVELVKNNASPGMRVAEVGCFDGSTSVGYIPIVQENGGHVYLIDWFKGAASLPERSDEFVHGYSEDGDSVYNVLMDNIRGFNCVSVLRGKSQHMAEHIPDESLDICFIDADHRYESVKLDIICYLPKMKKGGIICGHDCNGWELRGKFLPEELGSHCIKRPDGTESHPGVVQAVYEMFGDDVEIREDLGYHNMPIWVKVLAPVLL